MDRSLLSSVVCKQLLSLNHAVAGVDYIQDTTALTFDSCEPLVCDTVRALDDCVLEEDEMFRMILNIPSGQDPRIKIDRGQGDVTIMDQGSRHLKLMENALQLNSYSST